MGLQHPNTVSVTFFIPFMEIHLIHDQTTAPDLIQEIVLHVIAYAISEICQTEVVLFIDIWSSVTKDSSMTLVCLTQTELQR